jgi:hypothetical protein
MKLIRLTSDNRDGLFDNDFSTSEIQIKKNDKLALHSASFSSVVNVLNLNSSNDTLKFTFGTNIKTLSMTHGTYSNVNQQDLFDDIQLKLNNLVGLTAGEELGTQADVRLDDASHRIGIGYVRSQILDLEPLIDDKFVELIDSEYDENEDQLTKENGEASSTNDSSKMIQHLPIGTGSKIFRVRVADYVDTGTGNEDNGFIIGFSDIDPDTWSNSATMTDDEKTYYIKFVRNGTNYKYKEKGGTEQTSSIAPQNILDDLSINDYLELSISFGKIEGRIYKSDPDSTDLLFSQAFNNTTTLYPFITIQGSDQHIKAADIRTTVDPLIRPLFNVKSTLQFNFGENDPPDGGGFGNLTTNILEFSNNIVSSYFGYDRTITQKTLEGVGIIEADNIYSDTLRNTSFIIELRNIKIDSFNDKQRQNIIAVVPSVANREHEIVEYEPNNLYFVDVSQDLNLRNIQARILTLDGLSVQTKGLSVISLLLKSKDE